MPNVNKVMLIGNLTRDIELKHTPKGTAIAEASLAINRTRLGDDGQKFEETTFVNITLWGRTAEVAKQYTQKGQPLYVEGRLQLDTWVDKTSGKNRSKLKVVAENIQLLGGPKSSTHQRNPSAQTSTGSQASSPSHLQDNQIEEVDEIPF
jgi:single-strand DNA-binding protein